MKLWKEDLRMNIFKFTQGIFHIYHRSKDTADFHNLQGKLELVTLKSQGQNFRFSLNVSTFKKSIAPNYRNNKEQSSTQLDSRKQVIAFLDKVKARRKRSSTPIKTSKINARRIL